MSPVVLACLQVACGCDIFKAITKAFLQASHQVLVGFEYRVCMLHAIPMALSVTGSRCYKRCGRGN